MPRFLSLLFAACILSGLTLIGCSTMAEQNYDNRLDRRYESRKYERESPLYHRKDSGGNDSYNPLNRRR